MFERLCERARMSPRVVLPRLARLFSMLSFAASIARAEAPAAQPPPATDSKTPAPTGSDAGRALYTRYCQLCHAKDGTGYAADNAPSLVSPTFLASADDAFIARGIRLGRPNTAMAAYGESRGGPLDDTQISAIVSFLRSQGPAAVALPKLVPSGSAARGAAIYRRECESCHGSAKQPGKAPQLHNPEFLASASPAFVRHAIVHGRPPTRMPAFERRLDSGQIDDLVAWLSSLRAGAPPDPGKKPVPVVPEDLPLVLNPGGKAPEFRTRDDRFVSAEQLEHALSDWIQFHIPGAVPIPYYDTAKLDRVPNDGTWVIAYCACPHHASGEVVDALRRRGYPHTAVLDEGILYWRRTGYPLAGEAVAPLPGGTPAAQPPAPAQPPAR
jgi:mono/diheme cytochrome c family protein/rhodanese-related sulfurtransferase